MDNNIIIFKAEDMTDLLERDKSTISKHIKIGI